MLENSDEERVVPTFIPKKFLRYIAPNKSGEVLLSTEKKAINPLLVLLLLIPFNTSVLPEMKLYIQHTSEK